MNADSLVTRALQEARDGHKEAAKRTLAQALKLDPAHPHAWFLLSHLVEDPQQINHCLKQVLKVQPKNLAAKRRLAELNVIPSEQTAISPAKINPAPKKKRKFLPLFAALILIGLLSFVFGAAFLWQRSPALQDVFASEIVASDPAPTNKATTFQAAVPAEPSSTPFQPLPITATPTPTVTFTPTATYTSTATSTATITYTPTETPQPTNTIAPLLPPKQAHISNITGDTQKMPLSCEASAATDWAAYFGKEINEYEFQNRLPQSDNPDKGFVGNVFGTWGQIPPAPYGVHADPVAALLQDYGLNAQAVHAYSLNGIKQEVAAGRPVIIWVTGLVETGHSETYIDSEGERVIVAPYQHTVMVIGYNESSVTILDGGKIYQRNNSVFTQSWQSLGFQAIIMKN
jgi:uncharacterized protein YvpB